MLLVCGSPVINKVLFAATLIKPSKSIGICPGSITFPDPVFTANNTVPLAEAVGPEKAVIAEAPAPPPILVDEIVCDVPFAEVVGFPYIRITAAPFVASSHEDRK